MRHYLNIVDTNTGGRRNDVTPLFADAEAFAQVVTDLAAPFEIGSFDLVAGIDALGFVLGAALALHTHKGFLAIRKAGKLPTQTQTVTFRDYTGDEKSLSIRVGALAKGTRVLLVDDWIETGAQASAAMELIKREGGYVVGVAAINIDANKATRDLLSGYQSHSLWAASSASDA